MVVQFGPEAAKKEGIPTDAIFDIVFFVKPLSESAEQANESAAKSDGQLLSAVSDRKSSILRSGNAVP